MRTNVGSTVHPRYRGQASWHVEGIAELPEPLEYQDPVQGGVRYDPRILLLSSGDGDRVLWFAYWISTCKTMGKLKWGQGPPMLEEGVLLRLFKDAMDKGLFTDGFLCELRDAIEAIT